LNRKEIQSKRVLLALFGVIHRSIRYTWPNINEMIVNPLKLQGYHVEIYGFGIDVESAFVDQMQIDISDLNRVPFDYLEIQNQSSIDEIVEEKLKYWKIQGCLCKFGYRGYNKAARANAWRQFYAENKIAEFLRLSEENYEFVVVSGPDFYYRSEISEDEIQDVLKNPNLIMMSASNDASGYTNGFYVGQTDAVIKVTGRYSTFQEYCQSILFWDYEQIVKQAVEYTGIEHRHMKNANGEDYLFCKVRANGKIFSSTIIKHWCRDQIKVTKSK
jgi:hypothetical protein